MEREGDEKDEEQADEGDSGRGSPGKREPTEEEAEEQRAEDARKAHERWEEVMDAPPEQHAALQADAGGSTAILIGALFIIVGVLVGLIVPSAWGWVGAAIGVLAVVAGQVIRRRAAAG